MRALVQEAGGWRKLIFGSVFTAVAMLAFLKYGGAFFLIIRLAMAGLCS